MTHMPFTSPPLPPSPPNIKCPSVNGPTRALAKCSRVAAERRVSLSHLRASALSLRRLVLCVHLHTRTRPFTSADTQKHTSISITRTRNNQPHWAHIIDQISLLTRRISRVGVRELCELNFNARQLFLKEVPFILQEALIRQLNRKVQC